MQFILTLLLVSSVINGAQAQSWVGNYTVDTTTCNQLLCCCSSGTLVVTLSNSILQMNSGSSGSLCITNSSLSLIGLTTANYNATMYQVSVSVYNFVATLSSDSNTINLAHSILPVCSARAVRSNITMATSDAEKLVLSAMSMVAGILLGMINRMIH